MNGYNATMQRQSRHTFTFDSKVGDLPDFVGMYAACIKTIGIRMI